MTDRFRLRRPEYTGENRCRACTVVNVVALAVLVVIVGVWTPPIALAVGLLGAAAIWLRGYLVPYTPQFAPRLVSRLPARLSSTFFDHPRRSDSLGDMGGDRNAGSGGDVADPDAEAVFEALLSASVVVADDERLEPSESFATSWQTEMASLAELSDDALAETVTDTLAAAESARVERTGSSVFVVVTGRDGSVTWLRRPVALAEIGAVRALDETDVPAAVRPLAAHALCAFLDTCPACGGELVESAPDDCCGHTLPDLDEEPPPVLACEDCEVAFYRYD